MAGTILIDERDKIIRFTDIFDTREEYYCDTRINIREIRYNMSELVYYDILYNYEYSHDSLEAHKANPFNYSNGNVDRDGVILIKNEMTSALIKYLLMGSEELELFIGNTCAMQYKINIMNSLALFWD